MKPVNDGTAADVIYYAMGDLKGNIPQSVVNTATQKNPLVIDGLRKVVAKMDLSKYAPVKGDTPAHQSPASSSSSSVPAEAPPVGVEAGNSRSLPALEPPPREIMQALDIAYAGVLNDTGDDAQRSGTSEWVFVETRKDITISRKVAGDSPIHSFKGEGTIQRPVEEILDFVLNVPGRLKYDSMCKKIRKVREYQDWVNLIHSTHSTQPQTQTHNHCSSPRRKRSSSAAISSPDGTSSTPMALPSEASMLSSSLRTMAWCSALSAMSWST